MQLCILNAVYAMIHASSHDEVFQGTTNMYAYMWLCISRPLELGVQANYP
jgi:hypothetical protein